MKGTETTEQPSSRKTNVPTVLSNDETVHRRIRFKTGDYNPIKNEVTQEAFFDRNFTPSVDRALLRCVEESCEGEQNGAVRLIVGVVRAVSPIAHGDHQYDVDVVWRPHDQENRSHSQVESAPTFHNKRAFRKLRIRLTYLSEWVIFPADLRVASQTNYPATD